MENEFKCVQFVDTYYPLIDGVVSVVNNYTTNLNKHDGTYCCVVAPKFKDHVDELPYDVYRTKGFKIPFLQYIYGTPVFDYSIYQDILHMRPKILHAHSPFEEGKFAIRLGERLQAPVIATFHTKYYDDFKMVVKSDPIAQLMTEAVIRFYERCDYVWTMNRATANTMRTYGYKGDVRIMPNGADMDYYHRADELRRRAFELYDLPHDKKILLFVGQITWKKNLRFLIDVIAKLRHLRDDFVMVFVGDGYQQDDITEYADRRAPRQTLFLGQVKEREMLAGIYAATSLFFFPSMYDTASLVVREAAQMHVPSLLIEGADAADGVIHLENGFLSSHDAYKAANMLNELLARPELLAQVGDNAAKTLPTTWEDVSKLVLEEYKRIAVTQKPKIHTIGNGLIRSIDA